MQGRAGCNHFSRGHNCVFELKLVKPEAGRPRYILIQFRLALERMVYGSFCFQVDTASI